MDTRRVILGIRDLVCADPVALRAWSIIVDHLVPSAADELTIKTRLKQQDYREAVLETLRLAFSNGATNSDGLIKVFRDCGLNQLADNILASELNFASVSQTFIHQSRPPENGLWFEVGEVVHNFTGRLKELEEVHKMLFEAHNTEYSTGNMIYIVGLGGIGKSTLAKKYAFMYRGDYSGNVVWINAESGDSARGSFTRLAEKLQIKVTAGTPTEQLVASIYEKFQGNESLFIFDNVVEAEYLNKLKPKIVNPSHCTPHILVTTQRRDLCPKPKSRLSLQVWNNTEASEFVEEHLPWSSAEDALKLARRLGNLPLALQQAVAYIQDSFLEDSKCIAKYLEQFDKSEGRALKDERFKKSSDYSLTTYAVWNIALNRILELDGGSLANNLIRILAYLNPDNISTEFVNKTVEGEIEMGWKLLERFSIVHVTEEKVSIHRLVQQVIKLNLDPEQELAVAELVIKVIGDELDKDERGEFPQECMSHGLHLFPYQVKHSELMTEKSDYLSQFCYYLTVHGNFAESLSVAEQSYSSYMSLYGFGHESTIKMKWRTAGAHRSLGNHPLALEILESILPTSNFVYGEKHRLTIHIRSCMARVHSDLGDHHRALEIYEEIIPVCTELYGESNNVLTDKHLQASALTHLGRLDEALELFYYVLEKTGRRFGGDDPRTLYLMAQIGHIAFKKGDFRAAIGIWELAYDGLRELFGETDPRTTTTRKKMEMAKSKLQIEECLQLKSRVREENNASETEPRNARWQCSMV